MEQDKGQPTASRRSCRSRMVEQSAQALSYNKLRLFRKQRTDCSWSNHEEPKKMMTTSSYQQQVHTHQSVHKFKGEQSTSSSDISPLADPLRRDVEAIRATNQHGPANRLLVVAEAESPPTADDEQNSSKFIYQHDERVEQPLKSATRNPSDHRAPPRPSRNELANTAAATKKHVICNSAPTSALSSSSSCRRALNSTSSSSTRHLLVASVLLALLSVSLLLSVSQAYQLTNNLIANNLPPKFVQTSGGGAGSGASSEIVVRVKEGPQSIGKLIYTLKAEDPDDDPLTFGVLTSMASELVRIENTGANQANVYLRKELDRETSESHQVVITLTDGKLGKGNWITKSMLMIVEDVNDNYPVFAPHRTAISIREDTKAPVVIETLEASDADEGRFGQVVYKLDEFTSAESGQDARSASHSISSMFSIETIDGKGVISLIGQLDYEQRPLYQLRVLAIDRAIEHERLSSSTSILISVEDCEDQPPMFTFAPSITRIPEDLPIGSPILRLSAIDGDRGVNNPIKYSIVSVNNQESGFERNLFSIGSDSGQISVGHELDRELTLAFGDSSGAREARQAAALSGSQPGAYVLQVRASEVSALQDGAGAGGDANSVTTELTLILTDVNDETPQFNREHFYGELLENSPAESLVNFVLGGQATVAGQPQAAVQTSGTEVGAKVFDRDQGTNGTFTLHLEGEHGHLFDIWPSEATNEANIMLKVSASGLQDPANAKYFDYEKTTELRLTLVAREKFPAPGSSRRRFSSADMTIQLRDANDNYPQFGSELYRVEIPENAQRGMHICVVKALDADSGPFGTAGIRYTEIRGERANKFKLDPLTGVITLKTNEHGFDRETIPQHHLIVEARDNNGQGNRNTSQLLIVLTDVNDQRPKFLLDQYEAFIYENELDFQSPLQVQALDGDAPNSANSRLTYSIVAGDPQSNFTIEPHTGRIRVRTSLVMAGAGVAISSSSASSISSGSQSRGGQAGAVGSRTLSTLADGPNGATGSGESDIVISESAPQATAVAALQATGLDFERIAQKRDDTRQFNLTIKASDAGQPEPLSGTTQVIVLVYDKNDHAPVFTRSVYSKSIREDAPGGSGVIQVQALDGDHSPTNSKITYRISSGASDKFLIDSDSGLISVANGANLDIDRAAGAGQKRTNYLLNIVALDGSFGANQKSASALVNITIVDVNNKAPEFVSLGASLHQSASAAAPTKLNSAYSLQPPPATVFVNEDAPYGLIVTRVFATDLDSNAELRYAINYSRSEARNEEMELVEPSLYRDVFAIDSQDGTIKVAKPLDRELFDQVKLRLQVEDLAAQTADQVSHSYLTIKIGDVNDNRPAFKRPLYKAVVNENSISGTSVITLTADDRDLNKSVKYSIEANSPEMARLIRINPRSGEVTVNDKIDRELFPLINVTVKAEDFGQPHSLTGSCQLIVTVRDENDNNPIFLNSSHLRAPILSSSSLSTSVHSRHAPPTVAPHELSGEHLRNHNMQTPGGGSGSPASSYRHRSLGDGESERPSMLEHDDSSVAQNSAAGQPPQWRPLDEEGRELTLLAPGATARVREDAPVGHQVAYVRAEDADVGNNGRVTYLLDANSSGGGRFRIDRDSGILSVGQPLDRETQRQFALIIEACDNYDLGYSTGESRRAFTQVNILLTDINDNPPLVRTNLHASIPFSHLNGAAPTVGGYVSFDEAMQSPGPHDMPLAECLFINEFQAPNEPILTITATDLDDPETPNGQIDLAIINNLPQNDMFSLRPIKQTQALVTNPAANSADDATLMNDEPVSVSAGSSSSPTPSSSSPDLSGFGDLLVGSESSNSQKVARVRVKSKRSIEEVQSRHFLEPGNFYSSASNGPVRLSGGGGGGGGSNSARSLATHQPFVTTTSAPQSSNSRLSTTSSSSSSSTNERSTAGEQQMHIVVSQSLREKVGNYSILVRATDRGSPSLSSLKLINICVQDVNNHAPVFTRPPLNHTIRIMENATIGSFVTQVEATDSDHGLNGELQYALKPTNIQNSNNDWQSFKIDRLSGIISTTKLFNRQLKKYYTLRVQAQDFGRPTSLSSDIDINIMIVNAGKYQPEFEHQQQSLEFTENSAPGQIWFTLLQTNNLDDDPALIHVNSLVSQSSGGPLNAKDQKSQSANGTGNWLSSPCYHIVDGDDRDQVFHLDRYTHRLTNQRELDRERKSNYTLIVQASNNCNQQAAAPAMSLRQNQMLNDDESTTSSTAPGATSENLDSARPSAAVRRLTRGAALNERLQQQAPRSSKRIQDVEDETVDLTTTRSASAQKLQSSLTAAVEGASSSQQVVNSAINWDALVAADKSLLKVTIKIRDVNDNAPRFTQKIYTGGITTEADFGTIFMIVQAIDLDADANGQVTYSIVRPIKRNLSLSSGASTSSSQAKSMAGADSSGSSSLLPLSQDANIQTSSSSASRQKRSTSQQSSTPLTTTSTTNKPTHLQFPFNSNIVNEVYTNHDPVASSGNSNNNNELATSLLSDTDDLFVINAQSGEISLNFDPQKHMKGYFEFEILAKDPDGLSDSARVFIYLLRQDQRVKFVLRLTPQELRQRLNKFRSVMGNITGAIVNIDSYKYYENHDGTVDKKKTSLYLHFVKHDDNTIIEVDKVLTLIDNNIEYLDELYKEFHVLSSEAAHLPLSSGALVDPIDQVRTGLVGISSFLALILVLVIALCLNQRTRYERQLKAATVSAFGSAPLHLDPNFHSQTNLPNTNLHSQDPNPIWINGHYGNARDDGQIDWLSGSPPGSASEQHTTNSTKRAACGKRQNTKSAKQAPAAKGQQLYHSASSGVGMALDELDCLSSSEGDPSSDLNSLGGGNNSASGQLHYNVATATATPRDSLNSSHGQASSSSGSNSASTTNERQGLCTSASNKLRSSSIQKQQQQQQHVADVGGKQQTKVKLNHNANSLEPGANSTFGAFKEVTIYTERHQQPAQQRSFNYLVASQQQQQQQQQHPQAPSKAGKQVRQAASTGNQQQVSSHVNKLASQFNAAKLQKQSIYVIGAGQKAANVPPEAQQNQKSRILVHQNGSDVSEGIIRTGAIQQQQQQQTNGNMTKQMQNHLDAKFVPANVNNMSQRQQQDQTVTNFETSLSKLSILNLETTEL